MAILEDTLAQVKDLRLSIAKVRKENGDLRLVLETRITNLEKLIEEGQANPETIAALAAEVAGAREDLDGFDADVPDATA
jgi:methyl-accepting chemotaxis protein